MGYEAEDLDVAGDYAYIPDQWEGLLIVDVSDPADPVRIGSCLGNALEVAVEGDYAYVAGTDDYFRVVDVSDPHHPIFVGECYVGRRATDMSVAGDIVYLQTYGGLYAFNVADPSQPTQVAYANKSLWCVATAGTYVYSGGDGLMIWQHIAGATPTPTTIATVPTIPTVPTVPLTASATPTRSPTTTLTATSTSTPVWSPTPVRMSLPVMQRRFRGPTPTSTYTRTRTKTATPSRTATRTLTPTPTRTRTPISWAGADAQ